MQSGRGYPEFREDGTEYKRAVSQCLGEEIPEVNPVLDQVDDLELHEDVKMPTHEKNRANRKD